ncbi:sodium/calcium exchanger 2-like isoform X1 [Cyanistes caeruleus]|uniref:sodium/calcium exchanger 2-like isoform X1 n=1 Tax=Cyanistes caeruleus TaxID=156563 RepID=UPI000CDBA0EE|nr:sodium/calcium exchanger 2-like isoform X1 [Cyanistes caeruleus]
MHFLTVFWKVLFACVPPTALLGGWAAFGVSILLLALLTALIGDLAAHFGCTLGLKDSVNAVVFVALGTSIPDTFASRVAPAVSPCPHQCPQCPHDVPCPLRHLRQPRVPMSHDVP